MIGRGAQSPSACSTGPSGPRRAASAAIGLAIIAPRDARLADGPDEVHREAIAKLELKRDACAGAAGLVRFSRLSYL